MFSDHADDGFELRPKITSPRLQSDFQASQGRSTGDGIAPLLFPFGVERVLAMAKHRWWRADLIAANGGPVADDYCLCDAAGQAVARIY